MFLRGRTMFAPTSRVVEGADPYKLKPKYSQQPKQKIYAYPLFLLHIQAQKKKLQKRKRRWGDFALCGARQGRLALDPAAF